MNASVWRHDAPIQPLFIAVRDGTARQNDRLGVDRVVIGLALGLNADNGAGLIRNETFCRRARERCHAELVALNPSNWQQAPHRDSCLYIHRSHAKSLLPMASCG